VGALFVTLGFPFAHLHPWAVPLLCVPLAACAALWAFREDTGSPARRLLWPALLLVFPVSYSMASRWRQSDTGFADFLAALGPLAAIGKLDFAVFALFVLLTILLAAATIPALLFLEGAARLRRWLPRMVRVALAAGLAFLAFHLIRGVGKLPLGVNYPHMLGPVTVALALAGLVAVLVIPSRLGDLALAIGAVLYPLTAIDLFDSEFWPARSVAYLSIGVALLVAALAATFVRVLTAALAALSHGRVARFAPPAAVAMSLLLVGTALASSPPHPYEWYRLYPDDQFRLLQETIDILDDEPGARAVVYSWQPAVVLRALGGLEQARYSPGFYNDTAKREKLLAESDLPLYVLVDRFTYKGEAAGKADLGFLEAGAYRLVLGEPDGRFQLYRVEA
jgi:hypothetical protein